MSTRALPALAFLLGSTALSGCASTYYDALEAVGLEKRDILVDRVASAQKAQEGAQVEFKDALEQYRAVVDFDGGDLQKTYDKLSRQYDKLESEARVVRSRIDGIENVGNALFREWRQELKEYSSASLRSQSEAQLRETEARYETVLSAMNSAADRMDPVLAVFNDQVLFLKHNLNARAIAGLENEKVEIERQVDGLIREMDKAIAEAKAFIAAMPKS
ncbi:MAG: DUF2959 domain-containing protein [Pseudomonadota bacterium]